MNLGVSSYKDRLTMIEKIIKLEDRDNAKLDVKGENIRWIKDCLFTKYKGGYG